MKKQSVRIGVAALARKTFDCDAAASLYADIREQLTTVSSVEWVFHEPLIIEVEEAKMVGDLFSASHLDAMVVISATFHLGHLALELTRDVRKPILLWGLNELPYNGGKIRLNSVCGVNLDASNLYKAKTSMVQYTIGDEIDRDWVDAVRIRKTLSSSRIGILGSHAHGFYNLGFDELDAYREMGFLLNHYDLADVYSLPVDPATVAAAVAELTEIFNLSTVSQAQVELVAALMVRFECFMKENRLDALAVRCWPEFARDYGVSPCAAMSVLQSRDFVIGCEGDVEGTLSMLAHKAIGAETPFLADLSQVDFEADTALLWHCGVAPCNLWDGACTRSLDPYFANGKGVTADFVLKAGEVSVLRIDSACGKRRLFIGQATAMPMEKKLKGTYAKVRFERHIREVLDTIIKHGIAHHVSVSYGKHDGVLRRFAQMMEWELIE